LADSIESRLVAFATDAVGRGVQERHLQAYRGHADVRSTRRYARLADNALIQVLRPARATPAGVDLSRTCQPGVGGAPEIRAGATAGLLLAVVEMHGVLGGQFGLSAVEAAAVDDDFEGNVAVITPTQRAPRENSCGEDRKGGGDPAHSKASSR
jgi:hypothetical protein